MLRVGPFEYLRSLRDQFDELAAEFHVSAFGVLVSRQVAAQLAPLFLEGGDQTIYVIGQNGCGLRQLTNSGADDDEAAWSPDGRLIAFTRRQGASFQIHVINTDGTGARSVTDESDNSNPAWSPDGSTIAFASDRNGRSEIFLMNPDGSQQRPLSVAAPGWQPAWSPDGRRIAFVSNRDGQRKIYVMNADGSGQTQLTSCDSRMAQRLFFGASVTTTTRFTS